MGPRHYDDRFGGSAPENYEQCFVPAIGRPLALDLIDVAEPEVGERVLDVACGTGVIARLAAERVGAEGRVEGLDVNPGMLDVARRVTPDELSITWHQASAESIPLADASFDLVTCQMGLQFIADRQAALREMRRVLRPGGRLVLSVPGPTPSVFAPLRDGLARYAGSEAAGFVSAVFSLHDAQELERNLSDARFREVSIREGTKALRLPAPREFLWQYIHSTPVGGIVRALDQVQRQALEHDVVSKWQDDAEEGALPLKVRMLVAKALA